MLACNRYATGRKEVEKGSFPFAHLIPHPNTEQEVGRLFHVFSADDGSLLPTAGCSS